MSNINKKKEDRLASIAKTKELLKTVMNTLLPDKSKMDEMSVTSFNDFKEGDHYAIIIPTDSIDTYTKSFVTIDDKQVLITYYGKLLKKFINKDGNYFYFESKENKNGYRLHNYNPNFTYINLDKNPTNKSSAVKTLRDTVTRSRKGVGGKKRKNKKTRKYVKN